MMRIITLVALASLACRAQSPTRQMISYSELQAGTAREPELRASYGDDPLQFGELRMPSGKDSVPVVVFIHGGCWQSQYDIAHTRGAADALAKEGFAVWSLEYRRIGNSGGGWPGTFDDIAKGVDYVRTLKKGEPRLDLSRVVLMGHSAGGQLALWAASRKQGEPNGLFMSSYAPLPVIGVVSLAGITDLAAYGSGPGGCNSSVTPLMGGTAAEQPARYKAVSPIERADEISAAVHLVHGSADNIVPIAQSENFAARLLAAKVHLVQGAGHFDLVAPQARAWTTVVETLHSLTDHAAGPAVHVGQ